jgi:hypothetical protein
MKREPRTEGQLRSSSVLDASTARDAAAPPSDSTFAIRVSKRERRDEAQLLSFFGPLGEEWALDRSESEARLNCRLKPDDPPDVIA